MRDGKPYFQSQEADLQIMQKVAEGLFLIQCEFLLSWPKMVWIKNNRSHEEIFRYYIPR